MAGLTKTEKARLAKRLQLSENLRDEAEKVCPQRRAYNNISKYMTESFKKTIKENNYEKIFDFQEIAQEHNIEYHSVSKDRSQKFYSTLMSMRERFFDYAENPEKIRNKFNKEK